MNEIKKSVMGATSSSLAVAIFLIMLATDNGPRNDVSSIIFYIAILVLTYCTIMQWIKCVRKYVDFAIGQKINEVATKK
jgi:Na+/alanine symporter